MVSFLIMQIMIKEEDRLTSVIAEIDEDVCIVPRASYQKWPTGEVVCNRSFEGLTVSGMLIILFRNNLLTCRSYVTLEN